MSSTPGTSDVSCNSTSVALVSERSSVLSSWANPAAGAGSRSGPGFVQNGRRLFSEALTLAGYVARVMRQWAAKPEGSSRVVSTWTSSLVV